MIAAERFVVQGKVEIFPQKGGWTYLALPDKYTEMTKELADRGLIAIMATVGKTSWNTSMLPMGDGTHFLALNKKVRRAENIRVGNTITASFVLRER